jgi:hypothetical protein
VSQVRQELKQSWNLFQGNASETSSLG